MIQLQIFIFQIMDTSGTLTERPQQTTFVTHRHCHWRMLPPLTVRTNSTGGGCGNYSSTLYTDENNIINMLYCNQEIRDKPQLIFLFQIYKFKK